MQGQLKSNLLYFMELGDFEEEDMGAYTFFSIKAVSTVTLIYEVNFKKCVVVALIQGKK